MSTHPNNPDRPFLHWKRKRLLRHLAAIGLTEAQWQRLRCARCGGAMPTGRFRSCLSCRRLNAIAQLARNQARRDSQRPATKPRKGDKLSYVSVGDKVHLVGRKRTSRVRQVVDRNIVMLDRALGGYVCWNINDLVRVDDPPSQPKKGERKNVSGKDN